MKVIPIGGRISDAVRWANLRVYNFHSGSTSGGTGSGMYIKNRTPATGSVSWSVNPPDGSIHCVGGANRLIEICENFSGVFADNLWSYPVEVALSLGMTSVSAEADSYMGIQYGSLGLIGTDYAMPWPTVASPGAPVNACVQLRGQGNGSWVLAVALGDGVAPMKFVTLTGVPALSNSSQFLAKLRIIPGVRVEAYINNILGAVYTDTDFIPPIATSGQHGAGLFGHLGATAGGASGVDSHNAILTATLEGYAGYS